MPEITVLYYVLAPEMVLINDSVTEFKTTGKVHIRVYMIVDNENCHFFSTETKVGKQYEDVIKEWLDKHPHYDSKHFTLVRL